MKKLLLLFFIIFLISPICAFSQSEDCKKHERRVLKKVDDFSKEIQYYSSGSPIYIIKNDTTVTLIWSFIMDDLTDYKYRKVSFLCDDEVIDIDLDERNTEYKIVTGRDYTHVFNGATSIATIGKNAVFNRCTIIIKDEECEAVVQKVLNSKKTKVRVWSEKNQDQKIAPVIKNKMRYILNLYQCLKNNNSL